MILLQTRLLLEKYKNEQNQKLIAKEKTKDLEVEKGNNKSTDTE